MGPPYGTPRVRKRFAQVWKLPFRLRALVHVHMRAVPYGLLEGMCSALTLLTLLMSHNIHGRSAAAD
jgi:hypothetical protein